MTTTRDRLLDAAERLFASRGIDGVSVRDIVAEAEANVASVNYHFGSKEGMLLAVLERRTKVLADRRAEQLHDLETREQPPTVREIVETYHAPIAQLLEEDPVTGQRYLTLVARLAESGVDFGEVTNGDKQFLDRYLALLRRALPAVPDTVLRRRMAVAFTTYLGALGRPLSDGRPTPFLLELTTRELAEDVLAFMVAGLSAASSSPSSPAGASPSASPGQ